jgi:hypothetical protein
MGLFDFIGDALGAISAPFTAVIDAGTKLLGLPPVVGDALKIALGAATGDFVTLIQGSTQFLKDLAGSAAETEYAPAQDEAYGGADGWAPTASLQAGAPADEFTAVDTIPDEVAAAALTDPGSGVDDPEERQALDALARNFDALNRDGGTFGLSADRVLSERELRVAAEDPGAPIDVKRAARYVLDHPDLLDRLSRSRDGDDTGIARADIDLAREGESLEPLALPDAPVDNGPAAALTAGDAEEQRALDTLRRNFDAMNRDHGFLGAFGDAVITEKELRETAEDPGAALDLKRAARYVLDHPDLLERLARSRDGDDHGIAPGDIDLAAESGPASPGGTGSSARTSDELSALQTLLAGFDDLNHWNGILPPDKVLSREELAAAASDADTSPSLKRALRYVLDHPTLLNRLSRSTDLGVTGISRNDLQLGIEDARRGGSKATPAKAPTVPKPATSAATTPKSTSRKSTDPSIKDILNDKSLSVEEKIEMILMVLENRADDQMLSVTQQMDQNDDKKTNKDDRRKVTQLDKVDRDLNFKMERLMKRKEQLSNLLSTMEMKFASMAQTAIANMGR